MKRQLSVQSVLWSYRQSFHLVLLLLHTMFSILYFGSVVATRRLLIKKIKETVRGIASNRTAETTFQSTTPMMQTTPGEWLEENLWDLFGEHAFRWRPGEPWDIRLPAGGPGISTRPPSSTPRAVHTTTHSTTKAELDYLKNLETTEIMCMALTNLAIFSMLAASLFLFLWFLRSWPSLTRSGAGANCLLSRFCALSDGRRKMSRAGVEDGAGAGACGISASTSATAAAAALRRARARRSCLRMGLRETSFYMEIVFACVLAFALLTAAAMCLLRQDPLFIPAIIAVCSALVLVSIIVEISTVFFVRPGRPQRPSQTI